MAKHRLTIRHADLKEWMARRYPDQKPAFLFDEIERSTHSSIDANSFRALQVEHRANKLRLEKAVTAFKDLRQERDDISGERDSLKNIVAKMGEPGQKSETTYQNIIGGLLGLMLSQTPAGKPQSAFSSQASIISALLAYHEGKPGISATTLETKFAEAKRSLKGS
ncbi:MULTISPECIES: protein kinase [unclassified Pseudomonas]|uniref:protein kinase n=1 Tax=unclassified Pseudomonas TaxID=196821 RepID=UPI002B22ECE6|nr:MULTISPECIES: protein kinase [unclassified Pseudomonas]MEA9979311.1 protein kinase [Pseudomonas sp. RTS4]MEB0197900.1 protein kinase [Pseudomonas sp. 5S4]MEB0246414.1 protein kinase [Pseudomonas sp. 10S5]